MKYGILILIAALAVFSETLFEIKDSSNNPVLNVSSEGLTVLNNGDTIMVIGTQGIKAFIQQDASKALSRTFAVTTTASKDGSKGQNKVFEIAKDEGATFYNPTDNSDEILNISKGSITANVNPGLNRDFVVNDQASADKAGGGNLMKVSNKDGFEAVNDSTMLYYKKKNAFRIGYVSISDPDSVGQASFASGYKNVAMGPCATAMGIYTKSMGYGSTATGTLTKALAISSTAMGSQTTASGYNSTSMGYQSEASGNNSTASGWLTTSQSMNEFVVGNLNYDWGSHNLWIDSDPLFVVGNGIILGPNSYDRKNAVTVLKNGFMSIGNIMPNSRLDVAGDVRINDNSLYLRGPNDTNHGLKYREYWNSTYVNGPTLFGYEGGALGTSNNAISLIWSEYGTVTVPQGNLIVSSGGFRVSTGSVYFPGVYSTSGDAGRYVRVDSTGKLYAIETKDASDFPINEEINILKSENKDLRNELSDLRKELEEIKKILNSNRE